MATYRVQEDGKAPKNLVKGDQVVTGGGTWVIDGVDSNGNYQSSKVSDTNTSTYTGSYATTPNAPTTFKGSATGVKVNSNDQASIVDLMNQNSQAWWTADEAGKLALHANNEQLGALLGGSVTYDKSTGTWSGSAKTAASSLPPYNSPFSTQIDALLYSTVNRKPFSYDYTTDPTYLAYEDKYKRLGDRAREDTLGNVAALNGGYASSWATSAASQAQNDYNQQLSDIIPVLYDAAYNRYMDEYYMDANNLNLMMGVEDMYYGRHRDSVRDAQWQTDYDRGVYESDRSYDRGVYESDRAYDRGIYESDRSYDRGVYESDRNFNWNQKMDQWNMNNTEAVQNLDRLMTKWQLTGVADEEVSAALGVPVGATTESYYFNNAQLELDKAKAASSGGGGGGGDDYSTKKNRDLLVKDAKDNVYVLGYEIAARKVLEDADMYGYDMQEYYAICAEAGISEDIADKVYMQQRKEMKDAEASANDSKGRTATYWKNLAFGTEDPAQYIKDHYSEIVADGIDYMKLYDEVFSSSAY